jgi:hypothetical protein
MENTTKGKIQKPPLKFGLMSITIPRLLKKISNLANDPINENLT